MVSRRRGRSRRPRRRRRGRGRAAVQRPTREPAPRAGTASRRDVRAPAASTSADPHRGAARRPAWLTQIGATALAPPAVVSPTALGGSGPTAAVRRDRVGGRRSDRVRRRPRPVPRAARPATACVTSASRTPGPATRSARWGRVRGRVGDRRAGASRTPPSRCRPGRRARASRASDASTRLGAPTVRRVHGLRQSQSASRAATTSTRAGPSATTWSTAPDPRRGRDDLRVAGSPTTVLLTCRATSRPTPRRPATTRAAGCGGRGRCAARLLRRLPVRSAATGRAAPASRHGRAPGRRAERRGRQLLAGPPRPRTRPARRRRDACRCTTPRPTALAPARPLGAAGDAPPVTRAVRVRRDRAARQDEHGNTRGGIRMPPVDGRRPATYLTTAAATSAASRAVTDVQVQALYADLRRLPAVACTGDADRAAAGLVARARRRRPMRGCCAVRERVPAGSRGALPRTTGLRCFGSA